MIVGVGGVVAVRVGAEAGVGLVSGGGGSSLLLQHFWFRRLDCSAHRARPVQLAFALFLCKPRLDARLVEFVAGCRKQKGSDRRVAGRVRAREGQGVTGGGGLLK